jgi:predicted SAM-dependent methyltransferase
MSTIVLQHICVYEIRYNYLKEFYRLLKNDGILSIQMGYGDGHPNTRNYYDNYYDASTTNSGCDVKVTNPEEIIKKSFAFR